MNALKSILISCFILVMMSCSNNDDAPNLVPVAAEQVTNLFAPQNGGQGQGPISGEFAKFDFATGTSTDSATEWDIAFRGTTIIVNGGVSQGTNDEPERTGDAAAYIAEATFTEVTEVNTELLEQDSEAALAIPTGSGNGWYTYNFMTNLISPIAGRILVFRTRNGNYAKIEILSYYEDAPSNPDGFTDNSRYYTFNYVYQPNSGITTF